MHHHYQPPHLIEKDFGLSKDGKSTWSLRRRGRNAKTAQSSVGVGGTPTQPNFESRVRRSKFSQFARDGMLVMACIMQMFYPMNSMACIMWMLYPMTNFWHLRTHGARDAARCFFAWKSIGHILLLDYSFSADVSYQQRSDGIKNFYLSDFFCTCLGSN